MHDLHKGKQEYQGSGHRKLKGYDDTNVLNYKYPSSSVPSVSRSIMMRLEEVDPLLLNVAREEDFYQAYAFHQFYKTNKTKKVRELEHSFKPPTRLEYLTIEEITNARVPRFSNRSLATRTQSGKCSSLMMRMIANLK